MVTIANLLKNASTGLFHSFFQFRAKPASNAPKHLPCTQSLLFVKMDHSFWTDMLRRMRKEKPGQWMPDFQCGMFQILRAPPVHSNIDDDQRSAEGTTIYNPQRPLCLAVCAIPFVSLCTASFVFALHSFAPPDALLFALLHSLINLCAPPPPI